MVDNNPPPRPRTTAEEHVCSSKHQRWYSVSTHFIKIEKGALTTIPSVCGIDFITDKRIKDTSTHMTL